MFKISIDVMRYTKTLLTLNNRYAGLNEDCDT